jgi:hypothetical protein
LRSFFFLPVFVDNKVMFGEEACWGWWVLFTAMRRFSESDQQGSCQPATRALLSNAGAKSCSTPAGGLKKDRQHAVRARMMAVDDNGGTNRSGSCGVDDDPRRLRGEREKSFRRSGTFRRLGKYSLM